MGLLLSLLLVELLLLFQHHRATPCSMQTLSVCLFFPLWMCMWHQWGPLMLLAASRPHAALQKAMYL
jgi:hypothetical protein